MKISDQIRRAARQGAPKLADVGKLLKGKGFETPTGSFDKVAHLDASPEVVIVRCLTLKAAKDADKVLKAAGYESLLDVKRNALMVRAEPLPGRGLKWPGTDR
jgi:hypothetical protein